MKLYTVTFYEQRRGPGYERPPLAGYATLIDADTPGLAIHAAKKLAPRRYPVCRAELGDTRHLHPGTQEIMYTPAQTDLTEITHPPLTANSRKELS